MQTPTVPFYRWNTEMDRPLCMLHEEKTVAARETAIETEINILRTHTSTALDNPMARAEVAAAFVNHAEEIRRLARVFENAPDATSAADAFKKMQYGSLHKNVKYPPNSAEAFFEYESKLTTIMKETRNKLGSIRKEKQLKRAEGAKKAAKTRALKAVNETKAKLTGGVVGSKAPLLGVSV